MSSIPYFIFQDWNTSYDACSPDCLRFRHLVSADGPRKGNFSCGMNELYRITNLIVRVKVRMGKCILCNK